MNAHDIIRMLNLVPHDAEGGYYRETYRSAETIPQDALPNRYGSHRNMSTAIYYLLSPDTFSAMHRLASDEVFHFYLGDPVEMLQLYPDGSHDMTLMGSDLVVGQRPQLVVSAGVWQGCRLVAGGRFALLGTTVAPGRAVPSPPISECAINLPASVPKSLQKHRSEHEMGHFITIMTTHILERVMRISA